MIKLVEYIIKYSYRQTKELTSVLGEKQVIYKHNRPKNQTQQAGNQHDRHVIEWDKPYSYITQRL
jgi:hypothetical protein